MFNFNKSINIDYNNYKYINKFREKSLEERINTSNIIKLKYKNRLPVIVDSNNNLELEKHKYIVPKDLSITQFIYIIRKKLNVDPTQSIYLMCNNKLISSSYSINFVYDEEVSNDGFLYFIISLENTFG